MNDISTKKVCHKCIGDEYVAKEIQRKSKRHQCEYCRKKKYKCINIGALSEIVDPVFRKHYHPNDPLYPWEAIGGNDPEWIIMEMLKTEDAISKDIVTYLSKKELKSVCCGGEKAYYDMTQSYLETPIKNNRYDDVWQFFCETVKHKARFFNDKMLRILNDIFEQVKELETKDKIKIIRTIHPSDKDSTFYRARRIKNKKHEYEIKQNPSKKLGAPPANRTKPGRMNPAGIPFLYAAFKRNVCLSELRVPVGEDVISCKLKLKEAITVMDLSILKKISNELSLFDQDFLEKYSFVNFLVRFENEVSKPISEDKKDLEYIPTQVFTEYIANYYNNPKIDAIIYASTQTGGKEKNIVFLNHAIEIMNPDFTTSTQSPSKSDSINGKLNQGPIIIFDLANSGCRDEEEDNIERLSLIKDSIQVHTITGINLDIKRHQD